MAIGSIIAAGRVAPQTVVKDPEDRRLVRTEGRVLDNGQTGFYVEGNPKSTVNIDKREKVQVVQMPPKGDTVGASNKGVDMIA